MKITTKLAVAIVAIQTIAYGQTIHSQPEVTFPPFTVSEGQLDQNGFPTSGAKLCLSGTKSICYQMPSHTLEGSNQVTYDFGLEPHSKILPLTKGGSWALFSALFSAGGSGTLTRLAILRYQGGDGGRGVLANLLPYVGFTNVSEHDIWNLPSISPYPILVHADFIWGRNETHFSPHYYTVEAWVFDPPTDRYKRAFSYRTKKKYAGGDSEAVSVLRPERAEILRRLSTQ
jgi:hypothetical protein